MSDVKNTLPASIEAERSVIGALLLDDSNFHQVAKILETDDFYFRENRVIFNSICELKKDNMPIDPVILIAFIEKNRLMIGDFQPFIYEMANEVPASKNVMAYASIVRERSILRQLISLARETESICLNNKDTLNVKELIDLVESKMKLIEGRNEI